MHFSDASFKIDFKNSNEKKFVNLKSLGDKVINFLEFYGKEDIVGNTFYSIIGEGDGETRFLRLMKAAGYENDSWGFFVAILKYLEEANGKNSEPVKVNDVEIPYLLLVSILEEVIPGNRFYSIKKVRQLERLTNTKIPDNEIEDLQHVLDTYPVRLSLHTIRQMRVSGAVGYQYMPFVDELDKSGLVHTWVGQFHRGIVEQMYRNRVIFILNMSCPVYCRFCFRKHKECRNQKAPTKNHVKEAIQYIKNSLDVKEIVLTGGDPFMNKATLTSAIEGLGKIEHVQTLRIATRCISYYPYLFYNNNNYWLNYLKAKSLELRQRGKRIEIATHFIHPDEVSIESLDIISELVSNGIPVYVQTPFLNNCNDKGPELVNLFSRLRAAGAEIHYIYIPCSPIQGNRRYISPLAKGINIASYLRAYLSDRAIPSIVTATPIGKIDWNSSGWAVEKAEDDERYIWIRTPYTPEYYQSFAPILQLGDSVRVNHEGTLDVKFMADMGDESFFFAHPETQLEEMETSHTAEVQEYFETIDTGKDRITDILKELQFIVKRDQRIPQSIVKTFSSTLFRIHKTRVEFALEADDEEKARNLEYIRNDESITDVIVSASDDSIRHINKLGILIKELYQIDHIHSVRIRSLDFNYSPEIYSRSLVKRLGRLNSLKVANPKRIEIETQFLHSSEFKPIHKKLADDLARIGVSVYNITPVLTDLNDSGEEIQAISYKCRESGLEFHHLYLSGLPVQEYWNEKYPFDVSKVTEIATYVRRNGSGREIPRYVFRTPLGEVDYGTSSRITGSDHHGRVFIKLSPYHLEYYKSMEPDYSWPIELSFDEDEVPVVPVTGLILPSDIGALES